MRLISKRRLARAVLPAMSRKYLENLSKFYWLERFFESCNAASCPVFTERSDLYAYVHEKYIGPVAIDFLEFGVYRGDSILKWANLNTHSESRFFGFDSFKGLPEDWGGSCTEEHSTRMVWFRSRTTNGLCLSLVGSNNHC